MPQATPPEITKDKFRHYLLNRMDFRLEQWVMPPPDYSQYLLGDIIEDWQRKLIFEPYDATLHKHDECPEPIEFPTGDLLCSHQVYNIFYWQLPKKFAKTTILGGLSFEELIFARPGWKGYILAGKKDQAGILYDEVKGFLERNPNFIEEVDYLCYKDTIYRLGAGGKRIAELTKMSRDAMTTSGIGPDFYIFDEFWNQPDRQLWDVVHAGRVAKPNSKGVILTNAGFDTNSICYEVRETCRKATHKNYYYCEPGIRPKKRPQPEWINKQAIEEDRKDMPPNVFQRWHENKWTSKYGSAFPKDRVLACINKKAEKQFGGRGNYVMAIDAGMNRANFVAIVAHRMGNIKVDSVQNWKGKIGESVHFDEVGRWIETSCENFQDTLIVYDPWQMEFMAQVLSGKGYDVRKFKGTQENVRWLSSILHDVIVNGYLEIYPQAKNLLKDLLAAEMEQREYGWRLSRKFDFAITLGMACAVLMEEMDEDGSEFNIKPASDQKRVFADMEEFKFGEFKKEEDEGGDDRPYWSRLD